MSQTTPNLTDRQQLALNRARASRDGMFLHALAAAEIKDRLEEVNRTFTNPVLVTGFPEIWAEFFPNTQIVPDNEVLDLQPDAHDLVIHGLSLHWADDPVGQLIQARRALRPDGLFMAVLFGGQTLVELRAVLAKAETALTGGLSPRVAPMGEIRDLGGLLQRAGYALPVADSAPRIVSYADAFALMRDLRAMGEGNALAQRLKRPPHRRLFDRAAALYAQHYSGEDTRITATFEMVFLSGWAPDDGQQKPLRPGSASARLADALGTNETSLPD